MAAHPRSQRSRQPDGEPARPSRYATASVVVGLLVLLAGPVLLAATTLPHLIPTFGPAPLTAWPGRGSELSADGHSAYLYYSVLLLPAGGFCLAYLGARHRLRRWIAGGCVVLFGVQTVSLAAAVLWIAGTGLPANAIVDTTADESTWIVTSPFPLLVCLAAAAIMFVLARRTDFDAKSAEYFSQGDTVVRVRPLPLWLHALWTLVALAFLASVIYLPALAQWRIDNLAPVAPEGAAQPWPLSTSGDFAVARATYAVFLGIIAGAVASSLLKKALYRSPLGDAIQWRVDNRTANRWRGINSVTHYPIALAGGTLTACLLFLVPSRPPAFGVHQPDTTALAIFASISAALVLLGIFFVASAWKSGDDPLHDSPLQQGGYEDLYGAFATPARRKLPTRSKKRR
jgi:hypothetical protein